MCGPPVLLPLPPFHYSPPPAMFSQMSSTPTPPHSFPLLRLPLSHLGRISIDWLHAFVRERSPPHMPNTPPHFPPSLPGFPRLSTRRDTSGSRLLDLALFYQSCPYPPEVFPNDHLFSPPDFHIFSPFEVFSSQSTDPSLIKIRLKASSPPISFTPCTTPTPPLVQVFF